MIITVVYPTKGTLDQLGYTHLRWYRAMGSHFSGATITVAIGLTLLSLRGTRLVSPQMDCPLPYDQQNCTELSGTEINDMYDYVDNLNWDLSTSQCVEVRDATLGSIGGQDT